MRSERTCTNGANLTIKCEKVVILFFVFCELNDLGKKIKMKCIYWNGDFTIVISGDTKEHFFCLDYVSLMQGM